MLPLSLMISLFIALIFPGEVGLADPLGLDEIREQKFNESRNFDGSLSEYFINQSTGFFTTSGELKKTDSDIRNASAVQQSGDQSVITTAGFGFLDYIRVIGNAIQSIFIFLAIPVVLFFNMGYPYNYISLIYSLMYMVGIFSFLLGR